MARLHFVVPYSCLSNLLISGVCKWAVYLCFCEYFKYFTAFIHHQNVVRVDYIHGHRHILRVNCATYINYIYDGLLNLKDGSLGMQVASYSSTCFTAPRVRGRWTNV